MQYNFLALHYGEGILITATGQQDILCGKGSHFAPIRYHAILPHGKGVQITAKES